MGKLSQKGQVTIPIAVRRRLGLQPGDPVEFVDKNGDILLRRKNPRHNVFEEYIGALPGFQSIEEINAWVREMRDEDPPGNDRRR